jgi:hypothetical protein
VAPASWLVAYDVHEGRAELNFSLWGTYTPAGRQKKLKDHADYHRRRKAALVLRLPNAFGSPVIGDRSRGAYGMDLIRVGGC